MHEVAVARALAENISRVARQHRASQVLSARVRIGALACLDPETLAFAFDIAAHDMGLVGCALFVERVPAAARCRRCPWQGEPPSAVVGCPECGALGLELTGGREIELCSIDVDDEEGEASDA